MVELQVYSEKKQIVYSDVFNVGYERKRRFKNDFQVFDLYSWKDRVVAY